MQLGRRLHRGCSVGVGPAFHSEPREHTGPSGGGNSPGAGPSPARCSNQSGPSRPQRWKEPRSDRLAYPGAARQLDPKQASFESLLAAFGRSARGRSDARPTRAGSRSVSPVVVRSSAILTFSRLGARVNRDIRIPASNCGRQQRSGRQDAAVARNASTPRRNTGCHGFQASRRYTMRRLVRSI